ncbi:hypothetical protein WJX72_005302 [[Myrmecia] bisecta]|uniref:Generative cell specific-1/HAP2 domain-containing protein n=1 Tax=[Myrmecia] bisecta TaxID=41462 RepID=A0AAW1P4L3_9CHLO
MLVWQGGPTAVLLLLFSGTVHAASTVIANSQLQTCVQDGSSVTTTVTCSQKLVVTLAVESGTSLATEQLQFSVPCINSPDGACPCKCNYATDASCQCRDLAQAMNVVITKTPVYATYPLTYLKSFNSKPYEGVILTGGTRAITSCDDGAKSSNPTCGWAKDETGANIPDSQGFCCKCTASQVGGDTLGGGTVQQTRANLNCNLFASLIFIPGSASCLRFADLWYEGYGIGASQLDFTISVAVTTTSTDHPDPVTETLTITPSTPFQLSSSGSISAKLLGDLATYTSMPVLSSSYLMIPHPAGVSAAAVLNANQSTWMVVDNTMVSLDGTTCNKIGTSYTAFRYQAGACAQLPGSCLDSQLQDLYNADVARTKAGTTPRYFVTRWGGGLPGAKQVFKQTTNGPLWFGLPVTGISNSLLTLNVRADLLKMIVNTSPGKILSTQVCTFDNVTCGGFVALTQRGYLHATVQNVGFIPAAYTVTVANCSAGIQSIVAQTINLESKQSVEVVFQIYMQSDSAAQPACSVGLVDSLSENAAEPACSVGLMDSLGGLTDKAAFTFAVNATVYSPKPSQSDISDKLTGAGAPTSGPQSCDQKCGSLWNVKCAIWNWCWGRIFKLLAYTVGLFLLGSFIWLGISRGWFAAFFRCIVPKQSSGRRKHRYESEDSAPRKRSFFGRRKEKAPGTPPGPRESFFFRLVAQMVIMNNPLAHQAASAGQDAVSPGSRPAVGLLSKQRLLPLATTSSAANGAFVLSMDPLDSDANIPSGLQSKALGVGTAQPDSSIMLVTLQQAIARTAPSPVASPSSSEAAARSASSIEAAVDALVAGYQRSGKAYLNLAKLERLPPQLVQPGPSACVQGELQVVEDIEGGRLQLFFGVTAAHASQLRAYNAASGAYEKLLQPRRLDATKCSLLLPAEIALQLLTLKPVGQCLN